MSQSSGGPRDNIVSHNIALKFAWLTIPFPSRRVAELFPSSFQPDRPGLVKTSAACWLEDAHFETWSCEQLSGGLIEGEIPPDRLLTAVPPIWKKKLSIKGINNSVHISLHLRLSPFQTALGFVISLRHKWWERPAVFKRLQFKARGINPCCASDDCGVQY